MKKGILKGWLFLAASLLILLYTGVLYRLEGFGPIFTVNLLITMAVVTPLLLIGYRCLGTLPLWMALVAGIFAAYYSTQDLATALLLWTLCSATPLAVSLLWPNLRQIRPMALYALPLSGVFWLGGALGYCKLHFGSFRLSAMTEQATLRLDALIAEMKVFSAQMGEAYPTVYPESFLKDLDTSLATLEAATGTLSFMLITQFAFLLVCLFFGGLYLADLADGEENRWLGDWGQAMPTVGLSWIYLLGYMLTGIFMPSSALRAAFALFGFLYVMAGIYRINLFFIRRRMPAFLRRLLCGLFFALAFLTADGSIFTPYCLLMYFGWWTSTSIRRIKKQ